MAVVLISPHIGWGQAGTADHRAILLWPDGAPGAVGNEDADRPSIEPYALPYSKQPRGAVVICPGGGYSGLAMDYEGREVAQWLNLLGLDGFVLKYRLGPRYHHPAMLRDAQRALRYVRSHAAEFGIAPNRIGIWGFSAGGHLASTAATHFDYGNAGSPDPVERASSQPDFAILAYAVITCTEWFREIGSCENLLGSNPDPRLAEYLSNEKQVSSETPPTFLFHTDEDKVVPAENSIAFYAALRRARVSAELHIYEHGAHGAGLGKKDPVLASWPQRLADWFRIRGILPPEMIPGGAPEPH
ncbi:MAG: alpha/beta hydrolase [Acidobacteriia bacterium]|nr:alpha/beta hydrolase [Terriglobia bacterium]